ncbi:hypothetical protein REPUB_Repub02eG0096400 [Reevesia pubescens]
MIRDHEAAVIGACSLLITNVRDAFVVEAFGAAKALEFAKHLGLSNVILEGDALCITKKLTSSEHDLSPIGSINDEAKSNFPYFQSFDVSHIARDRNMITHVLAKQGLHLDSDRY